MPLIQLVLVLPMSEVCPRNFHQVSCPNLSSSREISALDHFMDFSSSEITLTAYLPILDPHPPTYIIVVDPSIVQSWSLN